MSRACVGGAVVGEARGEQRGEKPVEAGGARVGAGRVLSHMEIRVFMMWGRRRR